MKGKKLLVGSYTNYPQLDEWLIGQAEDAGFSMVSRNDEDQDFSGMSAILCYADSEPERTEVLYQRAEEAMSQGIDVIWVVSGDEPFIQHVAKELQNKRQFVYADGVGDATEILQPILSYHDIWKVSGEQQEDAGIRMPKLSVPKLLGKKSSGEMAAASEKSMTSRAVKSASVLEQVIAVAGHRGAGASFVAWNVAALLRAALIEGNTTGTLANWFGVDVEESSREDFLFHKQGLRVAGVSAALTAGRRISEEDLHDLERLPGLVVIDVGHDLQNPAWRYAGKKVFVATPDPQWSDHPFPDDTSIIRVMNRFPDHFPSSVEAIFNCKVNLVVQECGREVLMSLYGLRPWILSQPAEVRDQWNQVFGTTTYSFDQEQGGVKEWEESQFFS